MFRRSSESGVFLGKITLIGAGPGAADLLTLRAVRALERAQVVLYDRLVNPEILKFVPKTAQRIYVGKEPQFKSDSRQNRIYGLMMTHAGMGKNVVRLKGGDPFVFGRGGEEVLAMETAGFQVEVVPGLSSALSAPASSGIPVTHRGMASSFGVFTGHYQEGSSAADVDWRAAALLGTAVFLMGVKRLPEIVNQLQKHGRSEDTPIALIERATLPDQRLTTGTLGDILSKAQGVRPPTTIVVGDVVRLARIEDFLETNQTVFSGELSLGRTGI